MTETRAEKAQRLVDEGRVGSVSTNPYFSKAVVQGEQGPYLVTVYTNDTFFCTCDWGMHRMYTDDLCAHALAVKLAVERSEE